MRFQTISFVAAFGAVTLLGACGHSGESVGRDKLYNNATNADSEAFTFLKTVHEKAVFEIQLAAYVQSAPASPAAKELAGDVVKTYDAIVPELEDLAASQHVILPDPGMPAFAVPNHFAVDSLAGFNSAAYIEHVQHEQGAILEQLGRLSRNTSKALKVYAVDRLPAVKTLFAAAGGVEDHGAHH